MSILERTAGLIWVAAEKHTAGKIVAIVAETYACAAGVRSERDHVLTEANRLKRALTESKQDTDRMRTELAVASIRAERVEALVQASHAGDRVAEFRGRFALLEQQVEHLEKSIESRCSSR